MNEQEISAQPSEVKQLFDALTAQSGRKPEPPNNAPDKFGAAKNLPASYIEFMSLTDGWDEVGAGYIYGTAVGKNKDNMFVYTNEECKKDIEKYFYDLYDGEFKADDFTFFADDGMGGYYAFSKSERDEKVFYFDHDSPGTVTIYPDFVRWLKYKCKSDCLFMPDCITVQTAAKKAIWAA
ncbi:MAG: SMI1/KNR4 family protein, partial [Clostridiales bacterium]|nr:SMI1/KNR4 family protein [Clostridiales bacterium]